MLAVEVAEHILVLLAQVVQVAVVLVVILVPLAELLARQTQAVAEEELEIQVLAALADQAS
jgi:hypothetical protein